MLKLIRGRIEAAAGWVAQTIAGLLLLGAAGCAPPDNVNPGLSPQVMQQIFANGDLMLSCTSVSCVTDYAYHRSDLKKLYDNGDWNGLMTAVLSLGLDSNQAWFYLASAAGGLGYDYAAQRYYFMSLTAYFRCDSVNYGCSGLDVPALTMTRLADLDTELEHSAAFSQLTAPADDPGKTIAVQLVNYQGLAQAPALLNGKIPMLFVVDSGASTVTVPDGVAILMIDDGTLQRKDFLGVVTGVLANGHMQRALIFKIHTLRVGNLVVNNVIGAATGRSGELLLGQSFLREFKSWSIDNGQSNLVLQR